MQLKIVEVNTVCTLEQSQHMLVVFSTASTDYQRSQVEGESFCTLTDLLSHQLLTLISLFQSSPCLSLVRPA